MMTPQEVANCTFAKAAIGGYHMTSVDEFLDKLTEDYSTLYKENAALKAKLKSVVDKMAEYREMEEAMRSTLLTAQKMASSMVSEAEQKRNAMIASASADAQARRNELAKEVEAEERRLLEIRQRVDRELATERKRLSYGKEALRKFINDVAAVCNDELALLQRLPDLPMEEEKPALQTVPAVTQTVAPAAEADQPTIVRSPDPQQPEPQAQPRLQAPAAPEPAPVPAPAAPAVQPAFAPVQPLIQGDPFAGPSAPSDDMEATRVLNLEDLEFGRNYNKK